MVWRGVAWRGVAFEAPARGVAVSIFSIVGFLVGGGRGSPGLHKTLSFWPVLPFVPVLNDSAAIGVNIYIFIYPSNSSTRVGQLLTVADIVVPP